MDAPGAPDWRLHLPTDPQTSGGPLVRRDAAAADDVLDAMRAAGRDAAAVIGRVVAGLPRGTVRGT